MDDVIDISKMRGFQSGHVLDLGLRYVGHGDDWAELMLDYQPRFAVGPSGVLASGPVISLIDTVSGYAIFARLKRRVAPVTLDLRIDYMRSAPPGRSITARATCYRVTRNIAFVRCEAHDGDPEDLVALSMSSFYLTDI